MEDVGIFYGYLVYIFYGHLIFLLPFGIFCNLVYFPRFGTYVVTRKIWQLCQGPML
jgi:hypothetical protein